MYSESDIDGAVEAGVLSREAAAALRAHVATVRAMPAVDEESFRLLRHFMEHPGRVFSRERLLDSVWGRDSDIEPRTVDVHIRRLRKAINVGDAPDLIRTVRSAGYALDAEGTA